MITNVCRNDLILLRNMFCAERIALRDEGIMRTGIHLRLMRTGIHLRLMAIRRVELLSPPIHEGIGGLGCGGIFNEI